MTVPPEYTPQGAGAMPAGWYDDPFTDHLERYWTGSSWTRETRPKDGSVAPPPITGNSAPPPAPAVQDVSQVRDYLIPSILAVIFCAWPLAIIAVFFAIRTNAARKRGDLADATRNSERARLFLLLSAVVGLLIGVYLAWTIFTADTSGIQNGVIPQQ